MNTISIYNNQQRMNGIKASINYLNSTSTRKVGKKDTKEIAEDSCKKKDMTVSVEDTVNVEHISEGENTL